jgi:hypothetical protein
MASLCALDDPLHGRVEGSGVDWSVVLHKNLARVLPQIIARSGPGAVLGGVLVTLGVRSLPNRVEVAP